MGNKENRGVHRFIQITDQIQNLSLNRHIQCGRRLICNQNLRLTRQSHGDHYTLTHTAGHLMRIFMGTNFRIRNTYSPHHMNSLFHGIFFIQSTVKPKRFRNLLTTFNDRIQRSHRFLKNHGYFIAPDILHLLLRNLHQVLSLIENFSLGNLSRRIRNKLHNSKR